MLISMKGVQHQHAPNSAARRMNLPVAELSTERPTPRKLKLDLKHSGTQPKITPVRTAHRPSSLGNGALSTPRRVVTDSAALRMRDRLKNLNINGAQSNHEPTRPASSRVAGTTQDAPAANHPSASNKRTLPPGKPYRTPSVAGSGVGRASSVGSARPRKLNHVNGIVRQLDAANGSLGGSDIGSKSDSVAKKQPPKLKRKVPG